MTSIIVVFGAAIFLAGIALLVHPDSILGFLRANADRFAIHVTAVIARVILGVLLITQASHSRFPQTIEILGWIAIVAALGLAVIGRARFQRLISWLLTAIKPWGRVGGLLAVVFGGFVVYAFVGF